MAILGGIAKGVGRAAKELGKGALKAAEKVGKATSDSSKESSSLKSKIHKFDPLKKHAHEHGFKHEKLHNIINAYIEPISFRAKNGSLMVDKLTLPKIGDIGRNEVKFGQDIAHTRENGREDLAKLKKEAHNKVEKFVKEGGELLKKIEHHRGRDRLVKDIHGSLDTSSKTSTSPQDGKGPMENVKEEHNKLVSDVKELIEQGKELLENFNKHKSIEHIYKEIDELKSKIEELNEKHIEKDINKIEEMDKYQRLPEYRSLLEKSVHVMEEVKFVKSFLEDSTNTMREDSNPNAGTEHKRKAQGHNTEARNDDHRLDRAFSSARSNSMQHLSEDNYGVENPQSNGMRVENYPYFDVTRQKVVHMPKGTLNVEKSILRHKDEIKNMNSNIHNIFNQLNNNHQGNFNQQLRQFDPAGEMVKDLARATGASMPLPEDGSTQQNTNGTSSGGDKLNNKREEHKTSGQSYQSQRKAMESESYMVKSIK